MSCVYRDQLDQDWGEGQCFQKCLRLGSWNGGIVNNAFLSRPWWAIRLFLEDYLILFVLYENRIVLRV